MKIRVDQIGPRGFQYAETVDPLKIAATLNDEAVGYSVSEGETIAVDASLEKLKKAIHVRLALEISLTGSCRRCLDPTPVPLKTEVEYLLLPASEAPAQGEPGEDREELGLGERAGSFDLEVANQDVYHGDAVDLWPLLREQILLALPDYLLCKDACLGLCPVCGANLNQESCTCDTQVPDPRLAGLKDIVLGPGKALK